MLDRLKPNSCSAWYCSVNFNRLPASNLESPSSISVMVVLMRLDLWSHASSWKFNPCHFYNKKLFWSSRHLLLFSIVKICPVQHLVAFNQQRQQLQLSLNPRYKSLQGISSPRNPRPQMLSPNLIVLQTCRNRWWKGSCLLQQRDLEFKSEKERVQGKTLTVSKGRPVTTPAACPCSTAGWHQQGENQIRLASRIQTKWRRLFFKFLFDFHLRTLRV